MGMWDHMGRCARAAMLTRWSRDHCSWVLHSKGCSTPSILSLGPYLARIWPMTPFSCSIPSNHLSSLNWPKIARSGAPSTPTEGGISVHSASRCRTMTHPADLRSMVHHSHPMGHRTWKTPDIWWISIQMYGNIHPIEQSRWIAATQWDLHGRNHHSLEGHWSDQHIWKPRREIHSRCRERWPRASTAAFLWKN